MVPPTAEVAKLRAEGGLVGKVLKLALLLEKTHTTPGDLTYTRAFLEVSFVTYLPLSAPEQLLKNLVFSFSAHSSVSSGTWV